MTILGLTADRSALRAFESFQVSALKHRLTNLDLLRGLAALLVCAGHLRAFLFVDFGQVTSPGIFDRMFYFATGLGHQAVVVFFVLSGYLVGGSVLTAYQSGRWSWTQYALRRMTRLWVVLVPALLLTLLLDSLGRHWAPAGYSGAWAALYSSGPAPSAPADLRATTFFGNAVFLQTIQVHTFGTNGPLWSLANEFWYYVLFPLLCGVWFTLRSLSLDCGDMSALAMGGNRHDAASPATQPSNFRFSTSSFQLFRAALPAVLLAALLWWLPGRIVWLGLIWLFGVGAFWMGRSERVHRVSGHPALLISTGILALGSLVASKTTSILGTDYAIGLLFALWVIGLASINPQLPILKRVSSGLSDMSYTLYLVHFPVLAFIFFCFFEGRQLAPGPKSYFWFAALLSGAVVLGAGLWFCFERNTDWLRKRFEQLLVGRLVSEPEMAG